MKCIVAGSRNVNLSGDEVRSICQAAPFFQEITEIIHGRARGVDSIAGQVFSNTHKVTVFYADWDKYGHGAGMVRNREMAKYADALIAIWDGESRGTKNMIKEATRYGLEVFVYRADKV